MFRCIYINFRESFLVYAKVKSNPITGLDRP